MSLALGFALGLASAGCGDDAPADAPQNMVADGGLGVIDPGALQDARVIAPGRDGGMAGRSGGAGTSADGGPPRPADAAAPEAPFDAGGAAISGDVLTNHPEFGFVNSGDSGIVIVSAYLRVEMVPAFASVLVSGEIENRGKVTRCTMLFEQARIGGIDVIAVADGPAFDRGVLTLSTPCLVPGARGAFRAIKNEVPATLLEDSPQFTYAISGLEGRNEVPHPLSPILLATDVVESTGSHTVKGRLRTATMPIYNVSITFYAKDGRGLVVDDANAFPLELGTLTPNSTLDYESFPFAFYKEQPESLLYFIDFIVGTATAGTGSSDVLRTQPLDAAAMRLQQARGAREDYRRARLRAAQP